MEGGEGKGVAVPLLLAAGMESAGGCGARGWEWGLRSCGIAQELCSPSHGGSRG